MPPPSWIFSELAVTVVAQFLGKCRIWRAAAAKPARGARTRVTQSTALAGCAAALIPLAELEDPVPRSAGLGSIHVVYASIVLAFGEHRWS